MASVQLLNLYLFKIYKSRKKRTESIEIGTNEGQFDFGRYLKEFLETKRQTPMIDRNENRFFWVRNINTCATQRYNNKNHFVISTGHYGQGSDVYDVETLTYFTSLDENKSVVYDFNVFFYTKNGRKNGFCAFHRYGKRGSKQIFTRLFKEYLQKLGFTILMSPIPNPNKNLDILKNGDPVIVTYTKIESITSSSDLADNIHGKTIRSKNVSMKLMVNIKHHRNRSQIQAGYNELNGKYNIIFPDLPNAFSDAKKSVAFEYQGRTKVIDLEESEIYEFNINDDIDLGIGNHPTLESINNVADNYAEIYLIGVESVD
ncbi:MAG TPA: hypothetical protein PLR26_04620 [Bacilli bacterium]|nr:hypothetical protein [Bacilli bacterium]